MTEPEQIPGTAEMTPEEMRERLRRAVGESYDPVGKQHVVAGLIRNEDGSTTAVIVVKCMSEDHGNYMMTAVMDRLVEAIDDLDGSIESIRTEGATNKGALN